MIKGLGRGALARSLDNKTPKQAVALAISTERSVVKKAGRKLGYLASRAAATVPKKPRSM
jgi:hypothetical protein